VIIEMGKMGTKMVKCIAAAESVRMVRCVQIEMGCPDADSAALSLFCWRAYL
jgi:hypothetical protein